MPDFGPITAHRALRRFLKSALPGVLALALVACGTTSEDEELVPEQPVEQLYNDAMDQLYEDNYRKAAELFDEVERQHPYSVWATKGTLMSAFSYYRNADYAEAVVALDHFIGLHPAHENIDYAYYLRALCYYERITDVSRDQTMTARARESLEELINRFPDSQYAADAEPKLVLVRDQLAGKEMLIGRFYQTRGHYLAAINRFRNVITNYERTSHVPEALLRLTELYTAMGVMDQAQEYAAVLGYNFPGSEWYEDSYDLIVEHNDAATRVAATAPAPADGAPTEAPAPPAQANSVTQTPTPAPDYNAYQNYGYDPYAAYYQSYYQNYYQNYYQGYQNQGAYTNPYAGYTNPYSGTYQAPATQAPAAPTTPQAAPQGTAQPQGYTVPGTAPAPAPSGSAAPQYPPGGPASAQGDAWGGAQSTPGTTGQSYPGY